MWCTEMIQKQKSRSESAYTKTKWGAVFPFFCWPWGGKKSLMDFPPQVSIWSLTEDLTALCTPPPKKQGSLLFTYSALNTSYMNPNTLYRICESNHRINILFLGVSASSVCSSQIEVTEVQQAITAKVNHMPLKSVCPPRFGSKPLWDQIRGKKREKIMIKAQQRPYKHILASSKKTFPAEPSFWTLQQESSDRQASCAMLPL